MNWQEELLQHLEFIGIGSIGIDLFRSHLPDEVLSGTLLLTLMPIDIDQHAANYCRGSIQIVCRDPSEDAAVDKANSVINAIGVGSFELDSIKVIKLKAKHLPLPYPRSAGGLVEASVNFDINFVIK